MPFIDYEMTKHDNGSKRLEKAFDSLSADIDDLLVRYRAVKASQAELLKAAKVVISDCECDLSPSNGSLEVLRAAIQEAEKERR